MNKDQVIERILTPGVVAIIRADSSEQLLDASRALIDGGVSGIEITMTTPNALKVLADVRREFGDRVLPGMGTVLDAKTARMALEAGAQFIVTPVLRPDVITCCNEAGVPVFAGSYTPTEAQTAYELGADFIKIFPADGLGPKYISAMRAPLPHLKIVPTGGVDVTTAGEFIKAGCVAVAAGSTLVSRQILKDRDWRKLSDLAALFLAAVKVAREK
jgi:2-dehydro-3-deoxyphosphogluconate aldolase/(4S)-4-hydroxy-2-oxoglutarate aldolase